MGLGRVGRRLAVEQRAQSGADGFERTLARARAVGRRGSDQRTQTENMRDQCCSFRSGHRAPKTQQSDMHSRGRSATANEGGKVEDRGGRCQGDAQMGRSSAAGDE